MEKVKSEALHFRSKTGSSATRATSQGSSEFGDVALQPSVLQQLGALVNGASHEEEFNRQGGHYLKLLRQRQQEKLEHIFMQVALARLPKNTFMELQEEARRIWRREYVDIVPQDFRHLKKLRKLRKRQAAEARQSNDPVP